MTMEIDSMDDLARWLDGRPVASAGVISSRAVLSVLPLISELASSTYGKGPTFAETIATLFRAASWAWAAAKYPIRANELPRASVAVVAQTVRAVIGRTFSSPLELSPGDAAYRTACAADAAVVAAAGIADAGANVAAAAIAAVRLAASAAGAARAQLWQSVCADLQALVEGAAPNLLASRPLWIPHPISVEWSKLVQALPPNEDWEVWTEWYERRRMGHVYPENYELVFTRVPEKEWKKGPAAANAWIKAELAKFERKAIPNVASAFTFRWTEANRIALSSGPQNLPIFPFPGNEADQRLRLDAERKLVERIVFDLTQKQSNIRPDYLESLRRYASDLPDAPGTGNFLLADAEARILRALFESEASFLPQGFAARLKIMLEQHISLRVYYPEVERLYLDVRKGRLEEPLPQDAVEQATRTIVENTPKFFEPGVMEGLRDVE